MYKYNFDDYFNVQLKILSSEFRHLEMESDRFFFSELGNGIPGMDPE